MLRSAIIIAISIVAPLNADVTIRYKTDVTFNSSLPAAITDQAKQNMPRSDTAIRVKGRKGSTEIFGYMSLVDTEKQTITVIDPKGQRYATAPVDQFKDAVARAMPAIPPQAAATMSSMKARTESKLTGRTAEIRGIKATERELVLTVDAPEGAPFTGPMVRMVMQLWMADPGDAARIPAVRELVDLNLAQYGAMDPGDMIQKMLRQVPGMGEGLKSFADDLTKSKSFLLRSHIEMFMPMFAALSKQMPQGAGNPFANFDPNSPFMQMNQDVSEFSTDSIPDSAFQVPAAYKSASLDDIMKDMMSKFQGSSPTPQ